MDQPLNNTLFSGVKVVELATILAAPLVATFFRERGAEVIKIENPKTHGDPTRGWKPESEQTAAGISAYYISANGSKHVVYLDCFSEVEKVHDLLADADVFISNFPPSRLHKLGMDPASLKIKYPKLVAGFLSGYTAVEKPAFDFLLQAETGLLSITGISREQLAKIPVAWIDVLAAHQLFEALLMGYIHRLRSGEGSCWKVSLEDTALASLINQGSSALLNKTNPIPLGTLHPNIAPYGECFTTSDKQALALAIGTDGQFAKLWEYFKHELPPAHFTTNSLRLKHRDELQKALASEFAKVKAAELLDHCRANTIPVGRIHTVEEALSTASAKNLIRTEQYSEGDFQRIQSQVGKMI